jgi:hypothetical protein
MASSRGILNNQSLNELTSEKKRFFICMSDRYSTVVGYVPHICGVLHIRVIYDL